MDRHCLFYTKGNCSMRIIQFKLNIPVKIGSVSGCTFRLFPVEYSQIFNTPTDYNNYWL
jgi:hypothetical protein